MLTLGRAMSGAIAEAETTRAEASALLAAMSDEELGVRIDAAAFLAAGETYLDRYEDAFRHATRARALGRATGSTHPTLVTTLGTSHFMLGRLAEAAAVLDAGIEASRLSTVSRTVAWALHTRSYVAWLTGDIAEGLAMAEEAVERAARLDESIVSGWSAVMHAVLSLPAGSSEHVVEQLLRSGGGEELPFMAGAWRVMGLDVLARSLLAVGRRDEAARVASNAQERAAALGLPVAGAWAHRALAAVALHDGEAHAAAKLAIASAQLAEGAGVRVEAALSRMLAGRALAAAGDGDAAAAEFELAASVFEACGAGPHRDAAEQELRRLGRRIHRRSRAAAGGKGLASLTGRERQITALVVERKTNSQIAAELFLSPKTVETHLRNVFCKVGVASRVELARLVERG
jgi:DNA-binding CsgD family transcriptional regulator